MTQRENEPGGPLAAYTEMDYAALGARLLRPARPALSRVVDWAKTRYGGLAALLSAIGQRLPAAPLDQTNQEPPIQEVWEALAAEGLIPLSWVEDPRRLFSSGELKQEPRPYPRDLRQACLLASDVQGVLTAEALAWEVVERLQPWGAPRPEKVLWWQAGEEVTRTLSNLRLPGWLPWRSVFGALRAAGAFPLSEEQTKEAGRRKAQLRFQVANVWEAALRAVVMDANLAAAWRHAAASCWKIPKPETAASWPVGRAFRELPDPLQPILEIWRVGYALIFLRPDVLVLFMR